MLAAATAKISAMFFMDILRQSTSKNASKHENLCLNGHSATRVALVREAIRALTHDQYRNVKGGREGGENAVHVAPPRFPSLLVDRDRLGLDVLPAPFIGQVNFNLYRLKRSIFHGFARVRA